MLDLVEVSALTEDQARETIERIRWPNGPVCPHCGSSESITKFRPRREREQTPSGGAREGVFRCNACEQQFTVTVGTIFESSHIPLRSWLIAFAMMCASKKGLSALQIQRQLGIGSYRTAWFMCHRIRAAMKREPMASMLNGTVEVDETYVGGKPRKEAGKPKAKRGRGTKKTPVVALVERDGRVRARKIEHVDGATLKAAIRENVDRKARIMTDEWPAYRGIGTEFEGGHAFVTHSAGEYARGDVSTNTAESFFALLKRGVIGAFHHISKQHLDRYCDEFSFCWDCRRVDDSERTEVAIRQTEGKRLTYKEPTKGQSSGKEETV
jgi:transposase-like protein